MRFGSEGADPRIGHAVVVVVVAEAVVAAEQGLEVEGEPVRWERSHCRVGGVVVLVVGLLLLGLGLGLVLGGGVRGGEGGCEGVGVVGGGWVGVVVANGRHDGDVAVMRGIVGAGYTCQRTMSVVVLESIRWVGVFRVVLAMILVGGSEVSLVLAEIGGALCLLWGG